MANQESKHLLEIIEKNNQISNLQIVFTDIEKYSKRRTPNQIAVINALTACMKKTIASVSKKYLEYAQAKDLNFQADIVTLPTGDGSATVFTFDGLHDIHLSYALTLLEHAKSLQQDNSCDKFNEDGWCNCHPYFNLRIGISEGKGILFKDLRDQYNAAGAVMNMAARIMNVADPNQVFFTEEAYKDIIDMIDDPHLVNKFSEFRDVNLKHNLKVNIYQYIDSDLPFLNSALPKDLSNLVRTKAVMEKMRMAGFPVPPDDLPKESMSGLIDGFEKMAEIFDRFKLDQTNPVITINEDQATKGSIED